jgi:two-component system LytT family response regulator
MKTILIEDEALGRETLRSFISDYAKELTLIGEGVDIKSGLELINSLKPELVFLDINLPDGTVFQLLDQLNKIDFKIIFVTAFQEHAIKAFRYSAIDFLLKPLNPDDFMQAVAKVKKENRLDDMEKKMALLLRNINRIEKIALSTMEGLQMVAIEDVIRCKSESNYTCFYMINGDKLLVSKTLKEFDELLSNDGFYRIHKSHLINIKYIKKYINGKGGSVVLEDKTVLDVARRKRDGLLQCLNS